MMNRRRPMSSRPAMCRPRLAHDDGRLLLVALRHQLLYLRRGLGHALVQFGLIFKLIVPRRDSPLRFPLALSRIGRVIPPAEGASLCGETWP